MTAAISGAVEAGRATPGPWSWTIHDSSMATLSGPDEMRDHVLSVSPCKSCAARREEWCWGVCTVPTEADADLLAAAPDLLAALRKIIATADKQSLADAERLSDIRSLALSAVAAAEGGDRGAR